MPKAQSLTEYPRPNVAVDLVVMTVLPGTSDTTPSGGLALGVVVNRRADGVAVLPGLFLREHQRTRDAMADVLREKLDLRVRRRLEVEMLGVHDDPKRDPRGWVLSLAYATSVRPSEAARIDRLDVEVLPVHGPAERGDVVTRERLAYDHDDMVTTAVRRLRRRYHRSPDPLRLADTPWTMTQLRQVHEAVLDTPLKRDTFNRRMRDYVEPARDSRGHVTLTSETVGRPAQLFQPVSKHPRDPEEGPFPLPRPGR